METALSLWGYDISGKAALLYISAYIVVGVFIIWCWPKISVPWPRSNGAYVPLEDDKLAKFLDTRGKVRAAIIQVVGGITAVAAFITAIQQINNNQDTFRQKKADLFAKSVKELLAANGGTDSRAEALYILSYVARSDRSYERAVYDALSSYVTDNSEAACKNASGQNFHPDRTIQLAMRIIGERRPEDEETGRRLKLEGGCFVGLDLFDERGIVNGFAKARLSGSTMFHADFEGVDLPGAKLQGIIAGDYLNYGWSAEIGRRLHEGVFSDPRKGTTDENEKRRFVTRFIDANLQGADFNGANIQGADFSRAVLKDAKFDGAVISRTNFVGAQMLTAKQLEKACVGESKMSDEDVKLEQPYFGVTLRGEVKDNQILKGSIPKCK